MHMHTKVMYTIEKTNKKTKETPCPTPHPTHMLGKRKKVPNPSEEKKKKLH